MNLKKLGIATAVSTALGVATSGANATFLFDPDGDPLTNNTVLMNQFDFVGNSSILVRDGNQAVLNFLINEELPDGVDPLPTTFTVLTHTRVDSLSNTNIPGPSPSPVNEISLIAGFTETVTSVTRLEIDILDPMGEVIGTETAFNATFQALPGLDPNFIQLYYDPTPDADFYNGTGFGADEGAVLIYESQLESTQNNLNSFTATQTPPDGGFPDLDQNPGGPNPGWDAANGGAGQLTVDGTGSQSNIILSTDPAETFFNDDFFLFDDLTSAFVLDINLDLPFLSTDPSRQFYELPDATDPTYVVYDDAGSVTRLGPVNGGIVFGPEPIASGPDFLFSTDFNLTIAGARDVSAPGVLSLLGMGLVGLFFSSRRKKEAGKS